MSTIARVRLKYRFRTWDETSFPNGKCSGGDPTWYLYEWGSKRFSFIFLFLIICRHVQKPVNRFLICLENAKSLQICLFWHTSLWLFLMCFICCSILIFCIKSDAHQMFERDERFLVVNKVRGLLRFSQIWFNDDWVIILHLVLIRADNCLPKLLFNSYYIELLGLLKWNRLLFFNRLWIGEIAILS